MASKNLMQMSTDIVKLDRFDGGSFKRWKKKMQFLLATLNVAYVLTKPYPEESENEILAESLEQLSCGKGSLECSRGTILHGRRNKEIHDLNFLSFKEMAFIIDKLPSTWKDVKKNLKHRKDDLFLKDHGKHLFIEEQYHLENKANDDTSKVQVVEGNGESSKGGGKKRRHDDKDKRKSKKNKKDVICYNCKKPGHFKWECRALKKKQDGGNDNKNNDNNFVAMISEEFLLKEEKSWFKTIPKAHEISKETVSTEIPITTEGNNDVSILDHQQVEPRRSTRQRRQISFDDMLIFGTDLEQVQMTKKLLSENFDMKDLGEADVIIGIKILQKENRLMLTQSHYIEKILKRFDSFDFLPVSTSFEVGSKLTYNTSRILAQNKYDKVRGSLMYAMTCTRPDIAYAVGRLSRHTSSSCKEHWDAINRVFKYLKKTMDYCLEYSGDPSVLEGYTDASWITNQEDYASTSGWIFTLGGGAVSWGSKKQSCLIDSTMASEFMALASCCKEAEWLRDLLINIPLWPKPMPPIFMHCDSQSTLSRAYNQVYNGKFRHIGLRHKQVNRLINDGVIIVSFLRSSKNLAGPFTKGLPTKLIESFVNKIIGALPVVGLIARIVTDTGGVGGDFIDFAEFRRRVGKNSSVNDSRAFIDFQDRRGKAGDPLYVLMCCWLAALGAGLLKSEEILEGVNRLRISNDIEFEEETFIAMMNEAREKRAKLNLPTPTIPMEARVEKALDAIYVCCFGRDPIEEEDERTLNIMLKVVFPSVKESDIANIIKEKAKRVAEGGEEDRYPEPILLSKEAVQLQMKDLQFLQQNNDS
uniref:Photosystem I assembly factor PSA3, chloroplastic n=1 Tax=Tanacetum cinerariifolium TaxID=118510 RepID=A0A699GH73_TANCI|nr:photosystem I assembly factor PSA3, chloroplastic [Tanacetum cinerariifolium]